MNWLRAKSALAIAVARAQRPAQGPIPSVALRAKQRAEAAGGPVHLAANSHAQKLADERAAPGGR